MLKYSKTKDGITYEYKIEINHEELEKIINELDEKCSLVASSNIEILASSKEEIIEKITKANNGVSPEEVQEIGEYLNLKRFSCVVPIKKYTILSKLLRIILDIDSIGQINFEEKSIEIIEKLMNYSPEKNEIAGSDYIEIGGLLSRAKKCFNIELLNTKIKLDQPSYPQYLKISMYHLNKERIDKALNAYDIDERERTR